jgi:hypothetical protein
MRFTEAVHNIIQYHGDVLDERLVDDRLKTVLEQDRLGNLFIPSNLTIVFNVFLALSKDRIDCADVCEVCSEK